MTKRVLVTYASKAGSTAEVAAKIGETIAARNLAVDVKPVNEVKDLSAYQSVVLGSGILAGKFLPEALTFLQNHQADLQNKPVSLFFLCMTLKDDTEANRQAVSAYLDPARALVKPANEGMFAGAYIPKRLPFMLRLICKAMKTPEGDYRDWQKIQAWADGVAAQVA